jgi:hypothetical protein
MKQLGVIDYIHRIIKELKEKRKGEPKWLIKLFVISAARN